MILFHCCDRRFVDKILKEGMVPNKPHDYQRKDGKFIKNLPIGIYLSNIHFLFMHHATLLSNFAGAEIEVEVDGLELFPDVDGDFQSGYKGSCFFVKEKITPDRIKKIWVSTNDSPCSFKLLKR